MPGTRTGGYVLWTKGNPLQYDEIIFHPDKLESDDYRYFLNIFNQFKPNLVIMEHPFLWVIAEKIGMAKGWCSANHVSWWQIGPSKAKKLVLDKGNATKGEVLTWAQHHIPNLKSQNIADALLYLWAWQQQKK